MLRDSRAHLRRSGRAARRGHVVFIAIAAGIASLTACGVKGPLKLPTAPAATPAPAGPDAAPAATRESTPVPAPPSRAEPEPQPPVTRP